MLIEYTVKGILDDMVMHVDDFVSRKMLKSDGISDLSDKGEGVATVFIANAYGIDLSISDFITVIMVATLASIGTAGVPGVGLIMLAMVLNQVGLPTEGIALIIGIDRLLDMTRTAVNVTGDAAISCVVASTEKKINLKL